MTHFYYIWPRRPVSGYIALLPQTGRTGHICDSRTPPLPFWAGHIRSYMTEYDQQHDRHLTPHFGHHRCSIHSLFLEFFRVRGFNGKRNNMCNTQNFVAFFSSGEGVVFPSQRQAQAVSCTVLVLFPSSSLQASSVLHLDRLGYYHDHPNLYLLGWTRICNTKNDELQRKT